MKKNFLLVISLSIFSNNIFGENSNAYKRVKDEKQKYNYLGFTPTFIFMGMYGLVYSRAMNEKYLLTGVGGYTNFDLSPIPFLSNDDWKYENIYLGFNFTVFPFSGKIFPRGFFYGGDYVPSIGFWKRRKTGKTGVTLGNSGDILVGYSWIIENNIKISTDLFLNFNAPGVKISGERPSSKWVILPFFDINIGIVF